MDNLQSRALQIAPVQVSILLRDGMFTHTTWQQLLLDRDELQAGSREELQPLGSLNSVEVLDVVLEPSLPHGI